MNQIKQSLSPVRVQFNSHADATIQNNNSAAEFEKIMKKHNVPSTTATTTKSTNNAVNNTTTVTTTTTRPQTAPNATNTSTDKMSVYEAMQHRKQITELHSKLQTYLLAQQQLINTQMTEIHAKGWNIL